MVSSTVTPSTSTSNDESTGVVVSGEEVSSSSEIILPILIISFETNGGELIDAVSLTTLEGYTLSDAVRSGYTFLGWFSDEALTIPFTETFMPGGNLTLYSAFTPTVD